MNCSVMSLIGYYLRSWSYVMNSTASWSYVMNLTTVRSYCCVRSCLTVRNSIGTNSTGSMNCSGYCLSGLTTAMMMMTDSNCCCCGYCYLNRCLKTTMTARSWNSGLS